MAEKIAKLVPVKLNTVVHSVSWGGSSVLLKSILDALSREWFLSSKALGLWALGVALKCHKRTYKWVFLWMFPLSLCFGFPSDANCEALREVSLHATA